MSFDLHDRSEGVLEPDTLLGSQYFDRIRRRSDVTGEQRLMIAILEDAVHVYLTQAAAGAGPHRALFAEAEAWIESDDRTWIFAFGSICDFLGLDAGYLRRGLRAAKARARGEDVVPRPAAPIDETPALRRAS